MPNDHHVPRVHLRRFSILRNPKEWLTNVASVAAPNVAHLTNIRRVAEKSNFYTFADFEGKKSRELETFFSHLENDVAGVWRVLLDDPRYALTDFWPLPPRMRGSLARYLAAQIVRTTRQRKRLAAWESHNEFLAPTDVAPPDLATTQARYIAATLETIASALYARPWGLGFSGACLPTSDCPVVILNAHDDKDQVGATLSWDILFPLDPHRFIFIPDQQIVEDDPEKQLDHRLKLDGVGLALADAIYSAADKYVYTHPDHTPTFDTTRAPRLPDPGAEVLPPHSAIMYSVFPPHLTVRARWATHHISAGDDGRRPAFTGESFGL